MSDKPILKALKDARVIIDAKYRLSESATSDISAAENLAYSKGAALILSEMREALKVVRTEYCGMIKCTGKQCKDVCHIREIVPAHEELDALTETEEGGG